MFGKRTAGDGKPQKQGAAPFSEQVRNEHYRNGQRLKFYLLEVHRSIRGPQLILSRTHKNLLRRLFEMTVEHCMAVGLVCGGGIAVDASLICADIHRQRSVTGDEGLPSEAVGGAPCASIWQCSTMLP